MDRTAKNLKTKRQNPEVIEKERTQNTAGRKIKRQSFQVQENEREIDKIARKKK